MITALLVATSLVHSGSQSALHLRTLTAPATFATATLGMRAPQPIVSEAGIFRYYDMFVARFNARAADDIIAAWAPNYKGSFGASEKDGTPILSGAAFLRKQVAYDGGVNGPDSILVKTIKVSGSTAIVQGHENGSWRQPDQAGNPTDAGISFENDFQDTWQKTGNRWLLVRTKEAAYAEVRGKDLLAYQKQHLALRKRFGLPNPVVAQSAPTSGSVAVRVNTNTGEVIKGTKAFRVTVDTGEVVNQVEFYVNGNLRKSDESTPYDFELNTLDESDGPIKVRFVAYTALSHKAEKELSLTVNNEVGLGPEAHVKRGQDALTANKWDEAITEGRIALKARPNYVPARIVLARAFLGNGIIDEALNNLQEAAAAEPNNEGVLNLEANVLLRQAFNTFNTGGSRQDTLKAIRESLSGAVNARRKVLDAQVDAINPDRTNPLPYADAAIKAGRYSAAISALNPAFTRDNRRIDVGNRLAFAQMRALRLGDARATVGLMLKYGKPDAYTYALSGILAYEAGDDATSDSMMKQALLDDISNVGVRTAQAYIALRRNRTRTLAPLAQDLAKEEGQRSEVAYFLSSLYNRTGDYSNSRKYFEQALLIEPTNVDVYVEQANRAIQVAMTGKLSSSDKNSTPSDATKEMNAQLDQAASYFEVARLSRPESPEALTGLAIIAMLRGNGADASRFAEAAVKAGPEYTPGLYAYAGALQKQIQSLQAMSTRNREQADAAGGDAGAKLRSDAAVMDRSASDLIKASQDLLIKASKLDPNDLGGRQAPTATEAYRYYARHGQTPVMSAP